MFKKILLAIVFSFSVQGLTLDKVTDDREFEFGNRPDTVQCKKANERQLAEVNFGNELKDEFLQYCKMQTDNSPWCLQLIRPNPESIDFFRCTYGQDQVHQLIHPNKNTWINPISAVLLIKDLELQEIKICQIYNWWRPEPYNSNVGGVPERHPFGTAIDVRFCTKADQNKAFVELCKARKLGFLKAIGYYPTTALHFGINDSVGDTWGKSCEGEK